MGLHFQGAITSYLSGETTSIDDLIVTSGIVENLDVAPSGVVPPNPAELIQSPRLKTLFEELKTRYDLIIVDTAPVSLVSDTFHLAPLADMTIFVTRANYTSREMLPFIQEIYDSKRLPNMACVLNGVKAGSSYGHYGYGHTYGYGHYGYGAYSQK
jgi:capsular exopolysaccharide synthesis family protein